MEKSHSKIVAIALAMLSHASPSHGQDVHFEHVQMPENVFGSPVLSMSQDAKGYLWMGTQNGLFKYDGSNFTAYRNQVSDQNSISNDRIEAVATDIRGQVWVGFYHTSTSLDRLDPETGIFTHFQHSPKDPFSIASDSVNAIMQDHEGTIWIGTRRGLDRYDHKTNKFYHYRHSDDDPSSLSSDQVRIIYEDSKGVLWVGTGDPWVSENPEKEGGLNRLNRKTGKFTRYMHKDGDLQSLVDDRVNAIFEDSKGNFWVGTAGDGLHSMDREKGTFVRHPHDPSHPERISRPAVMGQFSECDDHISFITEDHKGRLFIGTFVNGINVYDPVAKTTSWFSAEKNAREKLPTDNFWRAFKTRDGVIWISTAQEHLLKVDPSPQNKLPHIRTGVPVFNFADGDDQDLWLAIPNGLLHQDVNGGLKKIQFDRGPLSAANIIQGIEKADKGMLWLASSTGLKLFDPSTHRITALPFFDARTIDTLTRGASTIRKASDGELWIGTFQKGLVSLNAKNGKTRIFRHDPPDSNSLIDDHISALAFGQEGSVWVATYRGLDQLNRVNGQIKHWLGRNLISDILVDVKGVPWAATNHGLFHYNPGTASFERYKEPSGAMNAASFIFGIVQDDHRNLWMNTSAGIIRLNPEKNEAINFGKNQAINPTVTTMNFGYARKNGDVLFGDSSGYFSFNNSLVQLDSSHPIAVINKFLLDDVVIEPGKHGPLTAALDGTGKINLKHFENSFSFEISNIDFISKHEDTRLLCMLENYDKGWRPPSDGQEVHYFNVPPGQYVFRVRAYGANSRFDEKSVLVTIAPPWWNTWWAYALYVICLGLAIFFMDRIGRRMVIQKERSKAKERELRQAKEIEKAYHKLKVTQTQLIHSEKMASFGELTAGIAHEIQNPLNFVNNFADISKELVADLKLQKSKIKSGEADEQEMDDLMDDIDQNLQKISEHGRRADGIVKSMLLHSKRSSGQKEPADIGALADQYFKLAYHHVRASDKDLTVAMETDIPQDLPMVEMVAQDIGRALLNLCNNAFQAVVDRKKKGEAGYEPCVKVTIRTFPSSEKPNTRAIDEPEDMNGDQEWVRIVIRDNGVGVPESIRTKIFQPFFTTRPAGQGMGLGLSLSYDIIKAHQGTLNVEAKEGEYAAFIIELPVKGA